MTRKQLQAMLRYTNEIAKISLESEDCKHGVCALTVAIMRYAM